MTQKADLSLKIPGVPIPGFGLVSCAGIGIDETRAVLRGERPGQIPRTASERIETGLDVPVFEVFMRDLPRGRRSNPMIEPALAEALSRAGLSRSELKNSDTGVCVGTTVASQLNDLPLYQQLLAGTDPDLAKHRLQSFLDSSPAHFISRTLGLRGPVLTVSNACASGADAIGIAAQWIRTGRCRRVIAIGVDELNRVPIAGFHALGVDANTPCTPFDRDRTGLNLGEGAAVLILESEDELQRRDVRAEFAVAGYGISGDAHHITSPHPDGEGLKRAVFSALKQARLTPEDIAFVNAHGTATPTNDVCESNALLEIFGHGLRYFSTKGWTGHTLGAAGALEFIFTLIHLGDERIPASRGFRTLPDDIPMPPTTQPTSIPGARYALSTSLAFGGSNAALVAERKRRT